VHPHLAAAYPDAIVEKFDGALEDIDLVFAALPHGHSQSIAGAILERGIPFVDLGADFRLNDGASYERWYGEAHQAPELLGRFVYGIPELNREAIRSGKAVAAAGCYATAAILALKPLVEAGLVDPQSLTCDAASGVSGAGARAQGIDCLQHGRWEFLRLWPRQSPSHAEIEMALDGTVLFTPHLAPMSRGILATCYGEATGQSDPLEALSAAYADEPFVHVAADPPSTKWVAGSNGCRLTARFDERTRRILAIAAIDNLGKGAAGQMIQCANLMLGLDETAGLTYDRSLPMSVTAAEGFVAAGCHAGIKKRRYDMALIATEDGRPVPCAAVFTQNKFVAPPVELDRATLAANGGQAAAVIVNSGNANAGTGKAGYKDAQLMAAATGKALQIADSQVIVCSTGIIGTPLPMDVILAATPRLAKKLSVDGGDDAARGILTTDHKPKQVVIRGSNFTLADGQGLRNDRAQHGDHARLPDTDADVPRELIQKRRSRRRRRDASTRSTSTVRPSTNDTALLMASGRRGKADPTNSRTPSCRLPRSHDADGARRRGHDRMAALIVTGAANDKKQGRGQDDRREQSRQMQLVRRRPLLGTADGGGRIGRCRARRRKSRVGYGGIVVARGGAGSSMTAMALAEHMMGD
jgi:N-acetyl-gamma-glutamyl-phosphate reductase common form